MSIEELVNRAYTTWAHEKGTSWTDHMRAAITEQAEAHALELRAYEATVQNLEQRIKDLQLEMLANGEAQRVPEGWQLVPAFPSSDMVMNASLYAEVDPLDCRSIYSAMLAAAPKKEPRHD
jgi:hypothetical protein